jgi:hypothetical protein
MIAGQKLVASDGYEVCLFPMERLQMTQDEGGDFSHAGTYNIDFVGTYNNYPLYAPCSLRIRRIVRDGSNGLILDSVSKVHLPNGDLDYITLSVAHSNNPPSLTEGRVFLQGDFFYTTGTAGYVTGDHVHMCIGQGAGGDLVQRSSGNWDLSNRIHMWDGMFVNDTVIVQGYGHNWQEWHGEKPPEKYWGKKRVKSFPFPVAWKNWGYVA